MDQVRAFQDENFFMTSSMRGIAFTVLCLFLLIIGYLWYLQVMQGDEYLRMARSNRVRIIRKPAPRGLIYDRDGELLVDNRPSFDVEVVPGDVEDMPSCASSLGKIFGRAPGWVRERIRSQYISAYLPVTVQGDVSMETMLAIEERRPLMPGVRVGVYPRRRYLMGSHACHLLGYLGMISREELEQRRPEGYTQNDLFGKSGVEKSCERFLAGRAGADGIQVDHRGCLDRVLFREEPRSGCALYLTVQMKTQRAAEDALGGGAGAVVALDPGNGEIIAMASGPGYDPNSFVPPADREIVASLMTDEGRPLMNRAIQGAYSP